jgi:L-aspartate oxidase
VPVDRAGVEDAALTLLAQAVLAAAGTRTESRGCHVRTDFPDRDDSWQRESLVVRLDDTGRPVVAPSAPVSAAPC